MYERTTYCPRAGIQIFITAPASKIDAPIMEFEWHISSTMSEVEPTKSTYLMCCFCDSFKIMQLSIVIINPTNHHRCELFSGIRNCFFNIFYPQQMLSLS